MTDPRSLQRMIQELDRTVRRLTQRVDIIEPRESIDPILYGSIIFDGGFAGAATFDVITNGVGIANKVQVTGFDTNGPSSGAIPDHTNDHITISKAGDYGIGFHTTARSAQSNNNELEVLLNNGVDDTTIHAHRTTSTASRLSAASSFDIITLAKNDTVELWLVRNDGGAVARTLTFEHVGLVLHKVGG